jgi:hypothetical protein
MRRIGHARLGVILVLGFSAMATAASAEELMGSAPWGFKQQNRAGIAAMMVQKESGTLDGSGSSGSAALAAGTSCGGSAGNASATGNYTCIILGDGTTASITALQEALGNQSSSSESQTSANGVAQEELSDVLESLTN